jgi:hypothetical protein
VRLAALEALGRDRLLDVDQRGQRVGLDHDGGRAEPRRLEGLAEHPGDRMAEVHDLVREQRLVVLDPGVVDPGHVGGGEDAHHAGHVECR